MLLWLLFAAMTGGVLVALLRPLSVTVWPAASDADADIAVFKDQLRELETDAARGLVAAEEAELARREVARRLLARADAADIPIANDTRRMAVKPLIWGVAGALPVIAVALYGWLGAPRLADRPLGSTPPASVDATPIADLVARVEARLIERPDDGKGWDVIAPIYFRQERFADAANAYSRANALLGETNARLAGFAEATVLANNGVVTEAARGAYQKMAKNDPARVEPKFWLALALEQDGRFVEAAAAYRAILAAAKPDADWRPMIEDRIAAVDKQISSKAPSAQGFSKGPSDADVAAAGKMSEADRNQMIRGMVASLAQRLATDPSDVAGWQRLMQSYLVLGERAQAVAALGDARRRLAGNPVALGELDTIAKTLGLGS